MPITRYKSGVSLNKKINIELFAAPGCGNCQRVTGLVKSLVEEPGNERIQWQEIDVLKTSGFFRSLLAIIKGLKQ